MWRAWGLSHGGSLTESPVHANVISSHLSTSWAHASGWDWAPAKLYHLISRLMPASEGEGQEGEVLGILGFQPIYKACIGNYLVPTCHLPPLPCPRCAVKASRAWWGKKDDDWRSEMLLCPEELCFSHCSLSYSFSFSTPSDIFSLSLSPSTCPPPSHLQSLSICLVILLHSLHIHFHSLSFFPSRTQLSSSLSFSLSVCHLYSGGTWRPRASVKNNCQYVCVCVCVRSCTHACSPARALAICSHSIRFA